MSQDLPERVKQTLAIQNKSFISIAITATGDDQTFAIDKEDYTSETMAVANAQAIGITEDGKNKYTLTIGSNITSLQQNLKPAAIEDNGPGGDNVFVGEFANPGSAPAKTAFENLSDGQIFDFQVVKGKADNSSTRSRDYIRLLGDLNERGKLSELAENTDRILQENNRFSGNEPYVRFGQRENEGEIGKLIVQPTLGAHAPKTYPQAINTSEVELQALKNLGLQILFKSSGELFVPQNTADFAQVIAAKAASISPGLARLGLKVPVGSFDPVRVLTEANPNFSKPANPIITEEELLSHGSYNNPLAPFDSIDSRSSGAAAALLVTTIVGIFEALSRAFDPKNGLQSPLAGDIFSNINSAVIPTRNDYTECVREGLKVFFGLQGDTPGAIIGGGFSKFNSEPGYYNTILRNLTKLITYEIGQAAFSAVVPPGVIQGATGPFNANSGLDIQPAGLSNDIFSNILNAVRRITQSRIVGFMNVMANMGDLSIAIRQAGLDAYGTAGNVGVSSEVFVNDIYDGDINPASLINKNYLSPDATSLAGGGGSRGRTLSWGQGTTPSMFILPNSIILAGDNLGGTNASTTIVTKLRQQKGFEDTIGSNRISAEKVEQIENALEASYVPFYFHDIRTNEIVSFHAFLENISEAYTAEYGESTGYGRIGKVYTYKNTDRSVSLGFRIVAVNEHDFETMWWKINKLVTLVYPQYTAGRTVDYEGRKFIQPFSQLPSASPLIRLRLGDVLKSNYSKFNLARMFGLGQGQERFSLNQEAIERDQSRTTELTDAIDSTRTRMLQNDYRQDERFYINYVPPSPVRGSTRPVRVAEGVPEQAYALQRVPSQEQTQTPTASPAGSSPRGTGATSTSRREEPAALAGRRYLVRVVSVTEQPGAFIYKVKLDEAGEDTTVEYYVRLPDLRNRARDTAPAAVGANISPYNPDIQAAAESSLQQGETQSDTDTEQNNTSVVRDFFSTGPNNPNPIFQAFESTKGRGLAGFIKSLRFDWNEAPWSVDGLNNKAPMMCKVEIEFAPINDLNPGIDSNGFNTAPIYRVGGVSEAINDSIDDDKARQDAIRTSHDTRTAAVTSTATRQRFSREDF
ncbi:MAG: hypothetical protein WC761_01475 [Candidatus Paceibacterota bacterium]|jgi:hypothetical protein